MRMNNKQKMFDNKQRFSFRKLTVGLASVLLGLTFMTVANTNQVQAAEQSCTTQSAGTQITGDSAVLEKASQSVHKDDDTNISDSHVTQDQAVSSLSDGQDRQDLNNGKDTTNDGEIKPVDSNSAVSNTGEQLTSKETPVTKNSLSTADNSESKVTANVAPTTVTTGSNTDNSVDQANEVQSPNSTKVKIRSRRAVTSALTAQDVINWDAVQYQKQADGNVDITGWDIDKGGIDILLPNTWDFAQKGIISDGKQAEITAKVMRSIAEASNTKAAAEDKTYSVKVSENGDGKLIAKDQNWSGIFDNSFSITDDSIKPSGTNLKSANLNNLNTSNVTNMSGMFANAINLQSLDVSTWDTHNVTDMSNMFHGVKTLQHLDISNWNTSNVTTMYSMFGNASSLQRLDVSNWNTSNVTRMMLMFSGTRSLQSLDASKWDTHNVTSMSYMFRGADSLQSLDVSNWDTSNVTNMRYMFRGAGSIDGLVITANNYQGTPVPGDSDTRKLAIISNVKDHFTDLNTWGNRPKTLTVMVHDESTNTDHEETVELGTIAYDSPEALRNAIQEKLTTFKNSKTDETHIASDPILTSNPANLAQELNATYKMNVKAVSSGSTSEDIINPSDPRKGDDIKQVKTSTDTYVIRWIFADDDPYIDKSLVDQNVRDNAYIVYQNYEVRNVATLSANGSAPGDIDASTSLGTGSILIRNDLVNEGVIADSVMYNSAIGSDLLNTSYINGIIKNISADPVTKNGKTYVARKGTIGLNRDGSNSYSLTIDNSNKVSTYGSGYIDPSSGGSKVNYINIYYYRDTSKETFNIKVKYIDADENDKLVTEQNLPGKLGDHFDNDTLVPPENYVIDPSRYYLLRFDQEHVLDPDNNPYMVKLRHKKTTNSENKTVTREVIITDPTGKKSTTTQTVTFTRDATVDNVTNQVTYDAWSENGEHTFNKVDVPPVLGYTASGEVPEIVVTPDTQSSTVNITYIANDGTQTIIYHDETGSEVGKQIISGKTDETVKVTPDLPDGYVVKGVVPSEVTIKPTDNPITITVGHDLVTIDPEHPVNPGEPIQGTKDKTYPDSLTHDDLNKTVTREVTLTDPTGKKSTTTQTVTFTRGATVDVVTNKVTYDAWSENGKHTFDKVDVPTITGYTASGEVPEIVVKPDTQSSKVDITYSANEAHQQIHYVDENGNDLVDPKDASGNDVEDGTATGVTNETVNVPVPDGWELVDSSDSTTTLTNTDSNGEVATKIVKIKHGIIVVDHTNPHDTGTPVDPNKPNGPKYDGVTDQDLNQDAIRKFVFYLPVNTKAEDYAHTFTQTDQTKVTWDNTANTVTVTQTVGFYRDAIVDKITGKVVGYKAKDGTTIKFGTEHDHGWIPADKSNGRFEAITFQQIRGYTPNVKATGSKKSVNMMVRPALFRTAMFYNVSFFANATFEKPKEKEIPKKAGNQDVIPSNKTTGKNTEPAKYVPQDPIQNGKRDPVKPTDGKGASSNLTQKPETKLDQKPDTMLDDTNSKNDNINPVTHSGGGDNTPSTPVNNTSKSDDTQKQETKQNTDEQKTVDSTETTPAEKTVKKHAKKSVKKGAKKTAKVTKSAPSTATVVTTPVSNAKANKVISTTATVKVPETKSNEKTLPQTGNEDNASLIALGVIMIAFPSFVGLLVPKKRRDED